MSISMDRQAPIVRVYQGGIAKTAVIYPTAFLVALALNQLALALVLHAKSALGATGAQVGILSGSWSLPYIVSCILIRPMFNRVLPRFLIIGSTAVIAGLTLAMGLTGSYLPLVLLYIGIGFVLGLFWPPMMGWLSTGFEGRRLGRVMAYFNVSWCSGAALGPLVCGWISERSPVHAVFLAAGLLFLVAVFVSGASLAMGGIRMDRDTGATDDAAARAHDRGCALRYPAWIGLFASYFGFGAITAVLPLIALVDWRITPMIIGLLFTVRSFANWVGFLALGRYHGWHFRRAPMIAAQFAVVLVFVLLALVKAAGIAAALLAVFGFVLAMSYAASLFYSASESSNKAGNMAIHESVISGGNVAGAVIGGLLYEWTGSARVFIAVAAVVALATVSQLIVVRKLRGGRYGES